MLKDPSGLIQMCQEVDRRMAEAMDACKNSWVNEATRQTLHASIHSIVNTLFITLFNDLRQLERDLGVPILGPDERFPTLDQMAEILPRLFSVDEGILQDRDRCTERMRWVFCQCLQIQGNLFSHLSTVPAVRDTEERYFAAGEMGPPPADLEEPYLILGNFERLKRLTFEYLTVRAELLTAFGMPIPGLDVSWPRSAVDLMTLVWKAYHRGEPSVSHLLGMAIRRAFFDYLRLVNLDQRYDLRTLPTSDLIAATERVGVGVPFGHQVLGNVIYSLENASARCEDIPESLVLPFVRIGARVVDDFASKEVTAEQAGAIRALMKVEEH